MSNIKNLTSKIFSDAEERKDSILAKANEEKAEILSKKENEAKKIEAEMIEKAKAEAISRKDRIISGAELKVRNEKLEAKQEVIEEVFKNSIEELCKMSDQEMLNFIKNKILTSGISGDENLILNSKGKSLLNDDFIKEINSELSKQGKKGAITLSNEVRDFKGGFILEKDGIEVNNTFEALVSSLRDDLEFEVAQVLFN